MDTPYYEQLQYVGDTRIQALISYTVAGDDRLARQALEAFDDSRFPEGITRSRYPSSLPQTIPTFSLLWIGMLRDYWMYRPDPEPASATALPGTRVRSSTGSPTTNSPTDCSRSCPGGVSSTGFPRAKFPPTTPSGESCMTTLQYLGALDDAAELEKDLGDPRRGRPLPRLAPRMCAPASTRKCWNADTRLLADTPDQKVFSQQANILAVLYDVVPKDERAGGAAQDAGHRAGNHARRRPQRVVLFPLLPGARAGTCGHGGRVSGLARSMAQVCCRCISAPGPRFRATHAPTRTPGPRIPSTIC